VTGQDLVIQLLECCEESICKDLTRSAGGSFTKNSEEQILAANKNLVVRQENTIVSRVRLHNMRQDRDGTIGAFGARLRRKAGICNFNIKCSVLDNQVNYTGAILCDVLALEVSD
jgi:hypothetical protein